VVNPLNAELNPICHLLALLGAHHILHISTIRVNMEVVWLHILGPYWCLYVALFCSLLLFYVNFNANINIVFKTTH